MQTLTRYLSNIMNSTLLGLPREIKELIYFDALSHTANKILVGPDLTRYGHRKLTITSGSSSFIRGQIHQWQRSICSCPRRPVLDKVCQQS